MAASMLWKCFRHVLRIEPSVATRTFKERRLFLNTQRLVFVRNFHGSRWSPEPLRNFSRAISTPKIAVGCAVSVSALGLCGVVLAECTESKLNDTGKFILLVM